MSRFSKKKDVTPPAPPTPEAEAPPTPEAEAPPTPEAEAPPTPTTGYAVAEGKALTCKKGVVSDGDLVKAEYFAGGQETLDDLVIKGYVIKS